MGLFNWFTQEIAIDLGTANTLIIHNDEVVVNEPSIEEIVLFAREVHLPWSGDPNQLRLNNVAAELQCFPRGFETLQTYTHA